MIFPVPEEVLIGLIPGLAVSLIVIAVGAHRRSDAIQERLDELDERVSDRARRLCDAECQIEGLDHRIGAIEEKDRARLTAQQAVDRERHAQAEYERAIDDEIKLIQPVSDPAIYHVGGIARCGALVNGDRVNGLFICGDPTTGMSEYDRRRAVCDRHRLVMLQGLPLGAYQYLSGGRTLYFPGGKP